MEAAANLNAAIDRMDYAGPFEPTPSNESPSSMSRINCLFLTLIASVLSSDMVKAEITLPAIFSDHMVLQQSQPVPVWGWAAPGETIQVRFANQSKTATADSDGRWEVKLDPLVTGEPRVMTISGSSEIKIDDVLVGEVWLGSGQSNMAMTVSRANEFDSEKKIADLPLIRMFKESSGSTATPGKKGSGSWQLCSPDTVGGFSATLYFFGREIHKELNRPVGLVNSSVGGTPIESWIDADAQRADPNLKSLFPETKSPLIDEAAEAANYQKALDRHQIAVKKAKAEGKAIPRKPQNPAEVRAKKGNIGGLFNGKIAPLIPYAIRGALWYQGEANSTPEKANYYKHQLPLLITDWRKRWGYDFPFAWAQLPNFTGTGRDWPIVREGMLKTLSLPNTGMGINIDIGDANDIHPKNKQEVGRRLSLWALGTVYEKEVPAVSGPLPVGHEIRGREIVVQFKHAKGLKSSGETLQGFEISSDGENWQPASASVDGESVVISSAAIEQPKAVRYAWHNNPQCNLVNGSGLPTTPFRTTEE